MLEEGVSPPTQGIANFVQSDLEHMMLQGRAWIHCSGESMYKDFIFDHYFSKQLNSFSCLEYHNHFRKEIFEDSVSFPENR